MYEISLSKHVFNNKQYTIFACGAKKSTILKYLKFKSTSPQTRDLGLGDLLSNRTETYGHWSRSLRESPGSLCFCRLRLIARRHSLENRLGELVRYRPFPEIPIITATPPFMSMFMLILAVWRKFVAVQTFWGKPASRVAASRGYHSKHGAF